MIERQGDLWDIARWVHNDFQPWIVVPTNGQVGFNGRAVMGAGVALQAAQKFPNLPKELGRLLKLRGNTVQRFSDLALSGGGLEGTFFDLITLPTKQHWKDPSDLDRRSHLPLRRLSRTRSSPSERPGTSAHGRRAWHDYSHGWV
jgi:hypothetical protein